MKKIYRNILFLVLLTPGLSIAADMIYEFSGEGESLLEFMQSPPHGQDYCSLRFYMNSQSIIYAYSKIPGAKGIEKGDRVVSINGTPIEGPPSIPDAVGSLSSKDKFKLILDRAGKPIELERACSNDTEIDKTITSLAEAIVAENWPECRKLIKKVEQHEKRAEWINIRMRCNYMYAQSKKNLAVYWNTDWPYDVYQYNREVLNAARYGSMEEFEALRPFVIEAISDLRRNGRSMYSGDLSNDFDATIKYLQLRDGLTEPEEDK